MEANAVNSIKPEDGGAQIECRIKKKIDKGWKMCMIVKNKLRLMPNVMQTAIDSS